MKISKKELSLEKGIAKEWLITNGIGGYASSTVIGANTRKYHGLLVAPLKVPAKRYLVLSKVDESIEISGKSINLYTNMGKQYISKGYEYLKEFDKEYLPKFTYKIGNISIEKTVCMVYGKNMVCVQYKVKNDKEDIVLKLAPIVNFRDFHHMSTNHVFNVNQSLQERKVKIVIDEQEDYPLYMDCSEGRYIPHENDTFENMYYIEEEKRGFYPEENHCVVGRYEIDIKANEEKEISFFFSLDTKISSLDGQKLIEKEEKRLEKIIEKTGLDVKEDNIKEYIIATDQFVINRKDSKLHSIIAGFPWFLDWGRDTLISFEGLLLKTKRYNLAKEVLEMFAKDIKCGLVPNGYSEDKDEPMYNSVDASLLFIEQVWKYITYTKNWKFVEDKLYDKICEIVDWFQKGIDLDGNNIYLDKDGLISSGTESTQNTWMDAKVEGFAVTPRNGKAVEINSLWYNALKILEEIATRKKDIERANACIELSDKCQKSFQKKFYNKKEKCLYDVLGDEKIRPNQLFSISLSHPVLDCSSKVAKEMMETVAKQLLNKYGLKTLSKKSREFVDVYEGNGFKRDMSYHQGITWPWLLGLYYDGLKNIIKYEKSEAKKKKLEKEYQAFVKSVKDTFEKELVKRGCIGSISELYDSKSPYALKGAFAQAWSVAEVFRIVVEN